jgi:hypothetical protein
MGNLGISAKPASSGSIGIDFVVQAGSAQYFVFMFGHTFATIIATALRAAGNRFPQHMIEASLVRQSFHQDILLTAAVLTDVAGRAEGW